VNSLDAIFAKLNESGVIVISQPKDSPWGRQAVIDDPDGNRVRKFQPYD
jgi:predicted enzyme related to lactoylglutathione lyase